MNNASLASGVLLLGILFSMPCFCILIIILHPKTVAMKSVTTYLLCLFIALNLTTHAFAQQGLVRGKIITEDRQGVAGASIRVKNSSRGGTTGTDGSFSIAVQGKETLILSAVGYETKEVDVTSGQTLEVLLTKNVQTMEEVVVTALGIKREKRQLTYSTQEVKGDVLTATKEPNVLNAMTGRVSGVQITSSTGAPGSSSRIVIRGTSSLLGENQALIVLDGVPINNDETGNVGPGAGTSRLADIDPSIIESINVLKGSAASALYGSRAARGVVMITTKTGGAFKKPQISFTSQVSFEKPILPELQNKYAQGENGVYFNGDTRKTSAVWGPRMDTLRVNGAPVYNRNPMEDFFQTGKTFTNTLNAAGGSDKSNYFFSYSYLSQEGTVPQTDFKRHTAFAKFNTKLSNKISNSFQFSYTSSLNNRVPEGYDLVSPLWTVYTAPFSYNPRPALDANGNQRVFRFSRNNPYWVLDNVQNDSRINRFIPVTTFTYNPTDWLSITERLGADIYAEQAKYFEAPSNTLVTPGTIRDRNNNFRQFNHDLIIEGRKNIGKIWNVSVLLGNNILSTYSQTTQIEGTGLTIANFNNVSNSSRQLSTESNSLQRKVGFYAQSNIEYKRLLNLSLTGRYDGSSVLSEEENFYPYGSASAGFIFSELLSAKAIDFGKLRVSYSSVGNDNIGPYSLNTPFFTAGNFPFGGQTGFLLSGNLGNSTLRNEKTNEVEVGLEMRFLKNRIGFEASYFNRKHLDLLTSNIPISSATGYNSTTLNAGDMTNKGFELLLTGMVARSNKFTWETVVNFTKIKNEVTRIYKDQPSLNIGQTFAFVGQPYGVIHNAGYRRNAEGRILIDANGLPIVGPNQNIGNIQPDWLAGITNNIRYGGWGLSFFFDVKKGGDVLNSDDRYGFFYGTPKVTEEREPRIVPGISIVDNKENTRVVSAVSHYQRLNLIYESVVQDVSYVKLRNVSLSYTFPKSMLVKTPFETASLNATGRNLWIHAPNFTGADPEVSSYGSSNGSQGVYGYSVPTSRSYNFTLSVSFK